MESEGRRMAAEGRRMAAEEMLAAVSEHGKDAASDYDDGLSGWFGWRITDGVLRVTFCTAENAEAGVTQTYSWQMVKMETKEK
jgi:hypothetical protein